MLSLLFYVAVRPQDDPVSRFEKFMRSGTSMKVEMGLKVTGYEPVGKGFFQAKRPNHVLWVMKWGTSDFSFSAAGDDIVAIERGRKVYREYGSIGQLFVPEPDISSTPEYGFPLALLAGSLKAIVPNGVKYTSIGKGSIEGVAVDVVRAQYSTPSSNVTIECKIDAKGRLLECVSKYGSGRAPQVRTMTFRNYAMNVPLSDSSFVTEVPKGFTAQTLPPDRYPINVGEKFPFDGWKPVTGSKDLKAIAENKVLFVAIGDPDCDVSVRATKTMESLSKQIQEKGGASVALCLQSLTPQPVYTSLPNFVDPTSKVFARLRVPGTPMFFLVSPKGTITRVWYGFDSGQAAEFVKDVLEWVDPNKGN